MEDKTPVRKEVSRVLLETAALTGPTDAVLAQEARGQSSLVQSDTLPSKIEGNQQLLTDAGVKFLGPVKEDNLFQYVELPAGWKKVATDHSMWTDLTDEKGKVRARIFYKAAFYDREAKMYIEP